MISFEEAMETVLKHARPLPPVLTRIEDAVGRTLLEDVASATDIISTTYIQAITTRYTAFLAQRVLALSACWKQVDQH